MSAQSGARPDALVARVRQQNPQLPVGSAALLALLAYIEETVAEGVSPMVVFDLDSTLFHTSQRNFQILNEFVAHHGQGREDLLAVTEQLAREGTGWNIVDDIKNRGITDENLLAHVRVYWRERFFTNEYLAHDLPVEGSPEFVRACYERGAFCYYLTGRDVPNMKVGTEASLRTHGFPMGPRTHLHMKGRFEDDDYEFKLSTLEDLKRQGHVVGVFENEPANANLFHRTFPEAIAVFLETIHSPGAPPVESTIYRIRDFQLGQLNERQ